MILVISGQNYATQRLLKEAKALNIRLEVMSAEDLKERKFRISIEKYRTLYIRSPYVNGSPKYIPQIIKLAKHFKKAGKKVVDANIALGVLGQGKWADYKKLIKAGLPIPSTKLLSKNTIPKTFSFILKWIYGFKARNVFLINNQKEFNRVFLKYPKGELLVQEFVKADYEYKVMAVGYKALSIVSRFGINQNGFRTDFKNHKTIKSSAIPKIIKLAEKACGALGRELAKVDILEAGGKFYILEVNRFPGLDSFEKLTKYNVTKQFIKYVF